MIVCLDLETTWLDNTKDKIIEVALVKFNPKTGKIIDTYNTLINPLIHIPEIISNITNIFDKDVEKSPILDEKILKEIDDFIWDNPILGHNINFDISFLEKKWIDFSNNIILDTFFLSNILLFDKNSLNLWSLCDDLWIDITWAHRAINDVYATIKLFLKLISMLDNLDNTKKNLISYIFSKSNSKSFIYILDLLWLKTNIKSNDEFIKSILKIIKKSKPSKKEDTVSFDINSINLEDIFKKLPWSETRPNQILMSNKVFDTLKNNKKILIEAPTWVWKTFAYLIPSILYSLSRNEKVFISTNTKSLQDQIFYKDLEFLKTNLDKNFTYTKIKWKRNYISISLFFNLLNENTTHEENLTSFFWKITLWLFETQYWEIDELNYYPWEYEYLKQINSDNFYVLSDENPYKNYEFLYKARKKANDSNIIIINHSVLAVELWNKNNILPKIDNIIIDEAHNLEDTLTSSLKKWFTNNDLKDIFSRINKILNKAWQFIDNIDNLQDKVLFDINLIFEILLDYLNTKNTYDNSFVEVLIEKDFFSNNANIKNIITSIELNIIEILNNLCVLEDNIYNNIKNDIKKIEEILLILKTTLEEDVYKNYIPLISLRNNNFLTLSYTHLNIWEYLQKTLWDKSDSVVLTSATLDLEDDFSYVKTMYSLWDFDTLKLQSDFDYKKNWLIFVPNDLWSIKYDNPLVNKFILDLLLKVKWKTLCLFTSFASIKSVYLYSNQKLKNNNINLLAQSIWWSKQKLISSYIKNSSNSVLFWTDSFWEWVDFPWDSLNYLVIYKFPFLVPNDPIFKARSKLFKDPFMEYSIKKSILKTKQWFWRLIRTKNDKWILILLDDRFINSSWWEDMKKAFPKDINIKIWSSANFLNLLK